jgi:hypothetical protein
VFTDPPGVDMYHVIPAASGRPCFLSKRGTSKNEAANKIACETLDPGTGLEVANAKLCDRFYRYMHKTFYQHSMKFCMSSYRCNVDKDARVGKPKQPCAVRKLCKT